MAIPCTQYFIYGSSHEVYRFHLLISIPNVQTIDELLVEKCQPGDVILFDRRCDCCASGAAAAMGCILGKTFLCDEDDGTRSVERGSYEHCGEWYSSFCALLYFIGR